MNTAIVAKLRNHLARFDVDEPWVVYLLCEARKLLDTSEKDAGSAALRMFCHWAMHVDLNRPDTVRNFLTRVDAFLTNRVAGFQADRSCSFFDEEHLFDDFVGLNTFRSQLKDLLTHHDLPRDLCDVDERWFGFLKAYAGVIEDGSLSVNRGADQFQAVEKVTFRKGAELDAEYHLPFSINWEILLKDGRIFELEFRLNRSSGMRQFYGNLKTAPIS